MVIREEPLGKQTAIPPTPKAQRAAARGHAAGEYHYGRISTIKDEKGNFLAYRVGPVPDPSGKTYRGARQASLDHVIKALKKIKPTDRFGRITVCIYGRFRKSGTAKDSPVEFSWICDVFNHDQLIKNITTYINSGGSVEAAAQDLFGLENEPFLVLAWAIRQHVAQPNA